MSNLKKLLVNILINGGTNTQLTISHLDTTVATSSDHTSKESPDTRRVQNGLLIWLDRTIDEVNDDDCRNTI
jgi:hypothetical protein